MTAPHASPNYTSVLIPPTRSWWRETATASDSSANLGARTLAQLCAELESAAGTSAIPGGTEILDRMEIEFARIQPALAAAFPNGVQD